MDQADPLPRDEGLAGDCDAEYQGGDGGEGGDSCEHSPALGARCLGMQIGADAGREHAHHLYAKDNVPTRRGVAVVDGQVVPHPRRDQDPERGPTEPTKRLGYFSWCGVAESPNCGQEAKNDELATHPNGRGQDVQRETDDREAGREVRRLAVQHEFDHLFRLPLGRALFREGDCPFQGVRTLADLAKRLIVDGPRRVLRKFRRSAHDVL